MPDFPKYDITYYPEPVGIKKEHKTEDTTTTNNFGRKIVIDTNKLPEIDKIDIITLERLISTYTSLSKSDNVNARAFEATAVFLNELKRYRQNAK